MPTNSAKFLELGPYQFENLIFDLTKSMGLQNLTWRTPGSDGGRDIEGDLAVHDLSGSLQYQRWYVECKRYETAIDWATIWKKIAFADNQKADFLLIATTSTLSPQCESEVSRWNAEKRRPIVRSWNVYELGHLLDRYPALLVIYGLATTVAEKDRGFLSLATAAAKLSQAAYSAAEFGQTFEPSLASSASLAELLSVRMDDIQRSNQILVAPYVQTSDSYSWQKGDISKVKMDAFGIRAALSLFRLASRASGINVHLAGEKLTISPIGAKPFFGDFAQLIFDLIAVWSNFELSFDKTNAANPIMTMSPRR